MASKHAILREDQLCGIDGGRGHRTEVRSRYGNSVRLISGGSDYHADAKKEQSLPSAGRMRTDA